MLHAHRHAFTLIELLVVITIIVVLLALLTPALDKAIYQAELTVCGAQMNAVADAQALYAFDNKRRYMHRILAERNSYIHGLKAAAAFAANGAGGSGSPGPLDDRPIHNGYIDVDWLMDPLAEKVEVERQPDDAVRYPQENIYCNYLIWYGWSYAPGGTELKGMKRMGDRWVVPDNKLRVRHPVSWLVSDRHVVSLQGASAGHPDRDGVLVNLFAKNGDFNYGDNNTAQNAGFNAALPVTFSFWMRTDGTADHGLMDLNFASADGSVVRLNGVANEYDDRVVHAPNQRQGGSIPAWANIAK